MKHDRSVRLSWPAHPRALPQLRADLRIWLWPLGFSTDTIDDIVLAASEAAANTIDHAYPTASSGGMVELSCWTDGMTAHVQVSDQGRWRLSSSTPSQRGFGIPLMRRLVDRVEIQPGPAGTSVLFRHELPNVPADPLHR
jgi:anti-sigma regulatory factor (Ser/Thr protein kinase)